MNWNELKFYVKHHKIMTLFIYLQLSLFFIIMGTFLAFVVQLHYESNGLQDKYQGKSIYHLLDGYYDGTQFEHFTSQPGYLKRLKNFYHDLTHTREFQYLAMDSHHILVKDTGLPEHFNEGYEQGHKKRQQQIGDETFTAVKSFQMNKQAFDFFGLTIAEGASWREQDVQAGEGDTLPALLGASYRHIFQVGDEIVIDYYFKPFTIKVIGFLQANSKIYYNGDPEFYLDEHILLPHQEYDRKPLSKRDESFQKISYFAMINGYIVTDGSPASGSSMMQRVDTIARKSAIGSYSFIRFNPHFLKYRGVMTILQENRGLVLTVFLSTALLHLMIIIMMLLLQQKKRLSALAIHYMNGATKVDLIKRQWLEILMVVVAAYITSFIILNKILKIGSGMTQFIMLFLCIFVSIIICLVPAINLWFRPLTKEINAGE
ncbi:hypothetical protein [Paenibacillus popilliae]|uniref:Permease n=1 Tax=Paenibacillus popilliae ATCC 14706 TaxID=1212764 RepID=M9LM78_PAEPP|nr:hypothetical protein [Paenibacillus popilliae]GAC41196.1 hypothetical protein PPOP_0545 [Paenibacillus popilliae ATCC 14706]